MAHAHGVHDRHAHATPEAIEANGQAGYSHRSHNHGPHHHGRDAGKRRRVIVKTSLGSFTLVEAVDDYFVDSIALPAESGTAQETGRLADARWLDGQLRN